MLRSTVCCVITSLFFTTNPLSAVAEETESAELREAREHSEQGQIHYNLGRFEEALREYERAYELYQHPAFLFNLGQCHRELGNLERAIFFFDGYLREQPDASNRDLVQELLEECQQALESRQAAPLEEQSDETADDPASGSSGESEVSQEVTPDDTSPTGEDLSVTDVAETEPVAPSEEEATRRPVYRRWWFWTILGVVVAGAVVGGTIGGLNASEPEVVPPAGTAGTVDWR